MNLTRRSLFASAVALLALPRRVAAERLLGLADGHDDTDYLQAVIDRTGGLDGSLLPDREYSVSRALQFPARNGGMRDMRLRWIGPPMEFYYLRSEEQDED